MAHLFLVLLFLLLGIFMIYFLSSTRIKAFQDYVALNRSIGSAPLAITMITIMADASIYGMTKSATKVLAYCTILFISLSY